MGRIRNTIVGFFESDAFKCYEKRCIDCVHCDRETSEGGWCNVREEYVDGDADGCIDYDDDMDF